MYNPRFIDPLVRIIRENSSVNEIIYSDIAYAAGMLSVFSERATSCGMLPQVRPFKDFDQITQAGLLVWFKELDDSFPEKLRLHIDRYNLEKIAETDLAYVYKNPSPQGKVTLPKPLIPETGLFVLLIVVVALIIAGVLF